MSNIITQATIKTETLNVTDESGKLVKQSHALYIKIGAETIKISSGKGTLDKIEQAVTNQEPFETTSE